MNIILCKFSNIIYGDGESQGNMKLLIDILAIALGHSLQKNRFKSSFGHCFFLTLCIITLYLLHSAYDSNLRASLINLDMEVPVDNTEV